MERKGIEGLLLRVMNWFVWCMVVEVISHQVLWIYKPCTRHFRMDCYTRRELYLAFSRDCLCLNGLRLRNVQFVRVKCASLEVSTSINIDTCDRIHNIFNSTEHLLYIYIIDLEIL